MAYVKGQPFKPQSEDVDGNPLALGSIEFYVWNTTTPTPYYTDRNGTQGGTSLTLNLLGKPANDIFFDDAIEYKLVVKDSSGSVIDTLGPYSAPVGVAALAQSSTPGGASQVGFYDPVFPSYLKTLSDIINGLDISAFRTIPRNLQSAILAGTSTTEVHSYLNDALAAGAVMTVPRGKYLLGATLNMVAGGGIRGSGEKTQFVRNFTGGQMIRHPGGNQLGEPIILRDFCLTKDSSITVADGDTGVDIGYASAWSGRGDISNILILYQWDGFKWSGGTMNPIHNIQVMEGKGDGFLGIDARGELSNCLAQYNAGNGYSIYAQTQGETGMQFTSCGTFANQGWGYIFDAATGINGANIFMKGASSSFDGTGGMGFSKEYRQIWMQQILIEYAGDAYVPFPSFTVHNDAPGLYMTNGCAQINASDLFIQTSRGPGVLLDEVSRANFTNLTTISNGRGGLGGSNAVGLLLNTDNTDINITNLIANYGPDQTVDVSIAGSGNVVDFTNATFNTYFTAGTSLNVRFLNQARGSMTRSVASASTITLPNYANVIEVSGTTAIIAITPSWEGREVTLRFSGSLTVFDGSNLILAGDLAATANDTLTLVSDGANWVETSRSVN
jgi:hypothetical protein